MCSLWGDYKKLPVLTVALTALLFVSCAETPRRETPPVANSTEAKALQGERRDLSADEALGGHTLSRHVGKSDEQLRSRLQRERKLAAASTYSDQEIAETTVGAALKTNTERIESWTMRGRRRPNLALEYHGDEARPVGRTLRRGAEAAVSCADAVVVLKADGDSGYYVVTSYPECQ